MTTDGGVQPAPPRAAGPRFAPPIGFVPAVWSAAWVGLFAFGDWQVALPMVLLTGPVSALGWRWRRAAKRRARAVRDEPPRPPVASFAAPVAERRMAASLVRVEAASARLDPDCVALVRELAALLRPLLARVRAGSADAAVRHDVEAIARDHLPAVLDGYLALPPERQHEPAADGTTPADRLRSQLLLLVEGCRELADAVHRADVGRQQQLGRFLEAKFRRSDLTA